MDTGVTAATDGGKAVDVRTSEHTAPAGDRGVQGAAPIQTGTIPQDQTVSAVDVGRTLTVKAREGIEFFHNGTKRTGGETFDMNERDARAASAYVDEVTPEGLRPVPWEGQQAKGIDQQQLRGMQRHERVGVLQDEVKRLEAQRDKIAKQLADEQAALEKDIAGRKAEAEKQAQQGIQQEIPNQTAVVTGAPTQNPAPAGRTPIVAPGPAQTDRKG